MKSPHQESPSVRAGEATGAGEGPTPDEGADERGHGSNDGKQSPRTRFGQGCWTRWGWIGNGRREETERIRV
jgi:hypothetical protein